MGIYRLVSIYFTIILIVIIWGIFTFVGLTVLGAAHT